MYIRRIKTKSLDNGEAYYTYRIVESVRLGKQAKQRTLLNLGKDFAIEPVHRLLLTTRIEQLLQGSEPQQQELFHLADELTQYLEASAQRYSAFIVAKLAQAVNASSEPQVIFLGGNCFVILSAGYLGSLLGGLLLFLITVYTERDRWLIASLGLLLIIITLWFC